MIFQVTSRHCSTGCTSPSYAFVGPPAVLAGPGGTGRIAQGNRPAAGFADLWRRLTFSQMALSHEYLQNPRQISAEIKKSLSLEGHFCSCCCVFNASVRVMPISKCLFSQLQSLCSSLQSCLRAHWAQPSLVQVSVAVGAAPAQCPGLSRVTWSSSACSRSTRGGPRTEGREGKKGGSQPPTLNGRPRSVWKLLRIQCIAGLDPIQF